MPTPNAHDLAQHTLNVSKEYNGAICVLRANDPNKITLSFAVGSTDPETAQDLERNHALLEQAITAAEDGKEPFILWGMGRETPPSAQPGWGGIAPSDHRSECFSTFPLLFFFPLFWSSL